MTDEIKADQESIRPADSQGEVARPTEYTSEIGKTICGRLVEDESLQSICAAPGMPDVATVARWISNNPEFRERYAFAREFQAHCISDEVIDLADAVSTEWVEKVRANGRVVRGRDRKNLPRCRLRIAVRNWVVDRLLARARELGAGRLFELPIGPESKILQGVFDFSDKMKESQHD
jgi:Bacteriophage Sf6, terminase small subunit-like